MYVKGGAQSYLDARMYLPKRVQTFNNKLLNLAQQAFQGPQSNELTAFFKIIETSIFGDLTEQEKEKDNGSWVEECRACQRRFTSPSLWANHLYAHTFEKKSSSDEFHLCTICGGEFINRKHF